MQVYDKSEIKQVTKPNNNWLTFHFTIQIDNNNNNNNHNNNNLYVYILP